MNQKIVREILDLMLNQNFQDISIIRKQVENATIQNIEIFDNNKYITFQLDKDNVKIEKTKTFTIAIMFWDRTHNLPIDCILFFDENGYIKNLEIYSSDLSAFENIDLTNIEIMTINQNMYKNEI